MTLQPPVWSRPTPFGSEDTRLVIVRGNSGSGKTSLAAGLREQYGRGITLVGQDNLRRVILRERDTPDSANIGLINLTVRYALDHGFHVVLEGILYAAHYAPMAEALVRDHRGHTYPYYLDIPFEETLRRHATNPQADEYGEKELRDWYRPQDFLPSRAESVIPASSSLAETTNLVMLESGLTADNACREAGALLDEYDSGAWKPADVERAFAEDLARGRPSGSHLRDGLSDAPPGRLTDLITRATPVFQQTRSDDTAEKLRLAL